MSGTQEVIAAAALLAQLLVFLGVIVRGRVRECYSFPFFVLVPMLGDFLVIVWPERFFRWDFWLLKEAVATLLLLAVALELAVRTFQAFPGARATARGVLALVVGVLWVAVLAVPLHDQSSTASVAASLYTTLAAKLIPRLTNGSAWVFTSVAAIILWYRLPVKPLHKAILLGFVPYLLIFTVTMNALDSFGWHLREAMGYAQTAAYLVLLMFWAYVTWSRDPIPQPRVPRGQPPLPLTSRGDTLS